MEWNAKSAVVEITKGADEVIMDDDAPFIDFYERFSENGKIIVYFGTKQTFEKWKISRVN